MKKRNSSVLLICLLVIISISLILYSEKVIESVGFSISIWKDNLFPSLFPFFVVSFRKRFIPGNSAKSKI